MYADWYVVSLHKVFGPHMGILCGRRSTTQDLLDCSGYPLQTGTLNYEACAGVGGLGRYWNELANFQRRKPDDSVLTMSLRELTSEGVRTAYGKIRQLEAKLLLCLMEGLERSSKVHMVRPLHKDPSDRLPIVAFHHTSIPSDQIVDHCFANGVVCRSGTFLSTPQFLEAAGGQQQPFVRLSMVHYNSLDDIHRTLQVLEKLPGWTL